MKIPSSAVHVSLIVLSLVTSATAATFQGLGLGAEPNSYQSEANRLSADGSAVAGGYSVTNGGSHPYRWTACTGMVRLDGHPGLAQNGGNAYGISGNGSLVAGFGGFPSNTADAFRWTEAGGIGGLGLWNAVATLVSDDGTVILGYGRLNGQFSPISPFMKSGNGAATAFDFPDYININAISRDNSIVVGGNGEADRWTPSTGAVPLDDLDPNFYQDSSAGDISADGTVIVGISVKDVGTPPNHSGQVHLVSWTGANNTINDLGVLDPTNGSGAFADATNSNGTIVVGSAVDRSTTTAVQYAFIWDATHGIRRLQDVLTNDYGLGTQLTGWQLFDATGISDDGKVIAGNGTYTDSNLNHYDEAWIATLYDTPSLTCGASNAYYNNAPHFVSLPLSGTRGVESRSGDGSGNGNHTFVFGFTDPVSNSSFSTATASCGTVVSQGVDPNNSNFYLVVVNTATCNQQYVTVNLPAAAPATSKKTLRLAQSPSSLSMTAGILIGDTNGDGVVNSADISQTKSRSGQSVDGTNYRSDLNADGTLNSADISLVKSKSGTALPSSP